MDPARLTAWESATQSSRDLFIFLDESGNYDFSKSGTRYLVYTSVTTGNIGPCVADLYALKHQVIASGIELEYFHATEDRQSVRNSVFQIIQQKAVVRVDAVVVEKRKTGPSLRPIDHMYPRMFTILLNYVLGWSKYQATNVFIFFDTPGEKKAKKGVEKGIKTALAGLAGRGVRYVVLMHDSKSHPYLQIADYCGWAIYKRWNDNDLRSHTLVSPLIWSEFNVFRMGSTIWY